MHHIVRDMIRHSLTKADKDNILIRNILILNNYFFYRRVMPRDLLDQLTELFPLYGNQDHPDLASALYAKGIVLHRAGRQSDAKQSFNKALLMYHTVFGAEHAEYKNTLAHCHQFSEDYVDNMDTHQGQLPSVEEFTQEYEKIEHMSRRPALLVWRTKIGNTCIYYKPGSEISLQELEEKVWEQGEFYKLLTQLDQALEATTNEQTEDDVFSRTALTQATVSQLPNLQQSPSVQSVPIKQNIEEHTFEHTQNGLTF